MTNAELQTIVGAVISTLRTSSRAIDGLTPVATLSDSDSFEVSGGRRVSFGVLKNLISSMFADDQDLLKTLINKNELKSVSITTTESTATLTVSSIGKTLTTSVPIATKNNAGLMTAADKSLLSSVGEANGLATLGPDGKIPAANLPVSAGDSVKEIIVFSGMVSDITEVYDFTSVLSTDNRCNVVYDTDNDVFLLRYLVPDGLGEGGTPALIPRYYRSWGDAGDFGSPSLSGVKPVSGHLYVCIADCTLHICKNAKLEPSGCIVSRITESEIDEMFN